MKNLKQYITEVEDGKLDDTPGTGTYARFEPDRATVGRLEKFCKDNKIDCIPSKDLHCTIVYSRTHIPQVEDYPVNLPISAKIKGFELLPTQTGKQALALMLESSYMQQLFKTFVDEYGATWDYDGYRPHITLSYDWSGPVPENMPVFPVHFNEFVVEELNEDWKPSDE